MEYKILFGLITGLVAAFVCLIYPITGFYSLLGFKVLLDGLAKYSFGVTGANAASIFGVLIIVLNFCYAIFQPTATLNVPVARLYYIFILVSCFSLLNSADFATFGVMIGKHIALISTYTLAYNLVHNRQDAIKSFLGLVFISIIPIIFGFWQLATGSGFVIVEHLGVSFHKIFSTFLHPNQYAFFLAVTLFAIIGIMISKPSRKLFLFLTPMAGCVIISILFTYSRSVWLSVVCCSLVYLVLDKKLKFYLVPAAFLILLLFTPLIVERFQDIISPGAVENYGGSSSLKFRTSLAASLLKNAFPVHPIVGFGLGSAPEVVARYTIHSAIPPHNDYMKVLIESGILGFIFFLSFIIANLYSSLCDLIRSKRNPWAITRFVAALFMAGVIAGTNHLGNLSTCGILFALMGASHKAIRFNRIAGINR